MQYEPEENTNQNESAYSTVSRRVTRRKMLLTAGTTALSIVSPVGSSVMTSSGNLFYPKNQDSSGALAMDSASASELTTEWVVSDGGSKLIIREDGTLTLIGPAQDAQPQSFSVSLPPSSSAVTKGNVAPVASTPAGSLLAVDWPQGVTLVVWPASNTTTGDQANKFNSWAGGISEGFLLELMVPANDPSLGNIQGIPTGAAELKVNLAPGGRWYGGAHLLRQLWPLDRAQWEVGPLYPFDHGPNGLGSVVGFHWVSSAGTLVAVDPRTPMLHAGLNAPSAPRPLNDPRYFGVGIQHLTQQPLPNEDQFGSPGDGMLRVQARASWNDMGTLHPWQEIGAPGLDAAQRRAFKRADSSAIDIQNDISLDVDDVCVLRVALAASSDARAATLAALGPLPTPKKAPPTVVLERPIWTTWATSHADVTQVETLALANAVINNGFRPGVLEIDDRWQSRYGNLDFDPVKFPDPKGMVDKLHELGFLVTVWVMPFLQEDSAACQEARALGYLVEGGNPPTLAREVLVGGIGERLGSTVKILVDQFDYPPGHWEGGGGGGKLESGQLRWWGTQPVRAIDLTNDAAVEWFVGRLKSLQGTVGLDGFKFDAGEPCFLPRGAKTHCPLLFPGQYTQLWVDKVVSRFEVSEVRSATGTTQYGGLVRMGDRDTVWGVENGLRSLVPALLTSAVLGYPFCLPDMVGGNAYWGQYPDTELMVRWAQVSVLMPAVQWSIPPWEVSTEAKEACAAAERVREQVLLPRLPGLVADASNGLIPICRPMWWIDPTDPETFGIDDQFLIGDDVVVAPVVEKGARQRRLYLPVGQWLEWSEDVAQESDSGQRYRGPCWVTIDAPLKKLPVFIRLTSA